MKNVLCSTGALIGIPNGRDYRLLEPLSKQLTCDGFEFMMYSSWYEQIEEIKAFLQGLKLYIPVFHCEKSIGEYISKGSEEDLTEAFRRFEINCDLTKAIGAEKLVLHLWSGLISDSNFQSNLAAYPRLKEIAESYGLVLGIENVVCNVENPMKHLCELRETYPDIRFVFDTKMAAFHEELEQLYEKKYEWLWKDGYICHYHVNDYNGGYMDWENLRTLRIGQGKLDFERFFAFIRETGYEGDYTLEATAYNNVGVVDVEMLNKQFAYVREKINR